MANRTRDLNNIFSLDIYLETSRGTGRKHQLHKLIPSKATCHPLMCWDIASGGANKKPAAAEVQHLQKLAARYHWTIDFEPILVKKFDALIVTDSDQKIIWASQGFKTMTGYSPTYALHKKPSFLQGKKTSQKTRNEIREVIKKGEAVEATIINYRKDGSEYLCQIEIIPLFSKSLLPSHFLAIEKIV